MAAVTSFIAAGTALGGLGLSIDQKLKSTKAMKRAQDAQDAAVAEMKALEFQDTFPELQVPTLGAELAFQQQQQGLKTGIEALQEQGPTGALGGVTKLEQARSKQALQTAARLEDQEARLDLIRQQNEQDIANRNVAKNLGISQQEAMGAGLAARDAAEMGQQADMNIVGSLGLAAGVAQEMEALYPEGRGRRKGREGSITDTIDSTTTLEGGFGLRQSPIQGLYDGQQWGGINNSYSGGLPGYYTLADWQKQNR